MAMQTDFLTYRLTIGLSTMEGRGFYYPSDTVIGHNHRLYVLNRSLEGVDRGIRVTMCDLDSEYYGTFGSYGEGDGQFVWPSGGTVDAQGHIYVTDEYLAPGVRFRCVRDVSGQMGGTWEWRRSTRRPIRYRLRWTRQSVCIRHSQSPYPEVLGER
jgi:hypothetical protein